MKAIVFPRYGSPDVLELREFEKPTPKDDEILIKVYAASANALDWHRMRADPFLVRLGDGLFAPKNPRLGADVAGKVEAVGRNITKFRPGDDVFGDVGAGSFAEYVIATEKHVTLKPAAMSFEQGASVGVAGLTALQGLRKGNLKAGQKVLVNGAAGGVGSFAVQIARAYGADVTGVCSPSKIDTVRSMGVSHIIDYTREDFTRTGQQYDLIYDAVGNRSVWDYKRALAPNGICVIAGFTTFPRMIEHAVLGPMISGDRKVGMMGTANINVDDLIVMGDLVASGKVIPLIDRCYPLDQTAQAIRDLEQSRVKGKAIIVINQ